MTASTVRAVGDGHVARDRRIGYATAMEALDVVERAGAALPASWQGTGLLIDAGGGTAARRQAVGRDLVDGFKLWRLAISLGWLDIKLRYRGSALGPFWLTLSGAVMVGSMGLIYGRLFAMNLHEYLPFLALSMILWQSFIGGLTTDACTVFLDAETMIRAMRMPFTVQVLRCVARNVIVLLHNLVVPIGVFAIFDTWPGWVALQSLPGLVLWVADGIAAGFLLGSLCARFRDIPPIVGSIMQIAFYITPIVWKPSQLGAHGWWLPINPFDTLLEIVRSPLLGAPAGLLAWGSALGYSLLLWLVALLIFTRARPRLAFWV
ncbi:ABC transporter permease [Lichenicoccus roseus]|uniref:ABC transporter permease n=1 Tax=Lichenicoccus roseus TaxID=2683649 RepID=A0A5R9J5J4_9PROT|nr:ABC transporter permease [Lichenicoccus roseus]TLU72229.1 ABC transporter permease [Lichenicoccus roseus]